MFRVLFLKYILEHSCEFLQIVDDSFYKLKKRYQILFTRRSFLLNNQSV